MTEINIDIPLYCAECNGGLCPGSDQDGRKQAFIVGPCPKCLKEKYDEGYKEGFADGRIKE